MNEANMTRKLLLTTAAMMGLGHLAPARAADLGSETAQLLNMMYADTRQDCGGPSRPAFLCSGVLFRANAPSTSEAFYSFSASSQARGGVSASYIRKDAKFKALASGLKSGLIFDTVLSNPVEHADYKVLCAYPIEAASQSRNQGGCGDSTRTTRVENYCGQLGVTTAEQWLAAYRKYGNNHAAQCAFDVRQGTADTANAFYQNLRAMSTLGTEKFLTGNELILEPWALDVPRSPSILASFYLDGSGLAGARLAQIQWYKVSKQVLPAIQMKLPQTQQQDASFTYVADSQAIYPLTTADKCDSYIQSAKWINRYDPGFRRNVESLSVVPTECGRNAQEDQTNNFFNEMVTRFYLDPRWINNADNKTGNIGSMRRQLICHFVIARGKAEYNLEPSRPFVTQQQTNAVGCNNT